MISIRLHPNHVVMLEADAWVLYAADNLAAATEAFEEVTSMGGNLERFRRPLIELYERTNRMDEAAALQVRSEERRVGNEGRRRWVRDHAAQEKDAQAEVHT